MELYYVYVVDKQNHLLGVVSLRKLLTSPINKRVEDIMISDIVRLHVDDYSDYIIDEFMKYQYNALPVVDLYNRLKGMITWDDVHDLFEEETTEAPTEEATTEAPTAAPTEEATTAAATTAAPKKTTGSPKTGVTGVAVAVAGLVTAGATAVVLKKRH